ncbi:hypothetical protein FRB96_007232 [Tulasnella sp. 330]|nr:hypothetical protein FRB96_007232 [Tulasnella sp. 330]KAG8874730.1 hypothetical protein FRB98_008250 [Tulasnella sp. 332]
MSSSNIIRASDASKQPCYTIPDFISISPSPLRVNPYHGSTAQVSMDWLDSFGVHPNPKHRAAFQSMDFGMLTAMCYADANQERFRLLCDYINALFAYDDLADEGGLRKDGDGTRKAADIIMQCLRSPTTHSTPFKIGKVFSSLWSRVLEAGISPGANRRFIETTDLYLQAVHQHVVNRSKDTILDIETFIQLRRDNGALKMCFAMGEFSLGLNIPDEVLQHPLIKIMEDAANDVVVLSNDIYSYNIEQAQGDTQNIIETTMKQKSCSLQEAMDFAGKLVTDRVKLFADCKQKLPSFGSARIDHEVQQYLGICEDWMTAGFHWSLRSDRYFGNDAAEVKRTRVVKLLPKRELRGESVIPGFTTSSPAQRGDMTKMTRSVVDLALRLFGSYATIGMHVVEWVLAFNHRGTLVS